MRDGSANDKARCTKIMAIDPDKTFTPIQIAVLTVSDTRTPDTDTSGDILASRIEAAGHMVSARQIVKDDANALAQHIEAWVDDPQIDAIISTGPFKMRDLVTLLPCWMNCASCSSRAASS